MDITVVIEHPLIAPPSIDDQIIMVYFDNDTGLNESTFKNGLALAPLDYSTSIGSFNKDAAPGVVEIHFNSSTVINGIGAFQVVDTSGIVVRRVTAIILHSNGMPYRINYHDFWRKSASVFWFVCLFVCLFIFAGDAVIFDEYKFLHIYPCPCE